MLCFSFIPGCSLYFISMYLWYQQFIRTALTICFTESVSETITCIRIVSWPRGQILWQRIDFYFICSSRKVSGNTSIIPWLFPSKYFLIHNSQIIIPFDATELEILSLVKNLKNKHFYYYTPFIKWSEVKWIWQNPYMTLRIHDCWFIK
jgi:hypothetical protein